MWALAGKARLHAGRGLRQLLPAGAVLPRRFVPIGVDRCVDDARKTLPHLLIAEPELLDAARTEVLHDHVDALRELPEEVPAFLGPEVEQDALLPAVDVVVHADATDTIRVVDLDDLGAELGERAAARRAREDDAEVEDLHPLEGGAEEARVRRRYPRRRLPQPLREHLGAVGVGRMGAVPHLAVRAVEARVHAGLQHPPEGGIVDLDHLLRGARVLLLHPLGRLVADRAAGARRVDEVFPLLRGAGREQRLHALDQLCALLGALRDLLAEVQPLRAPVLNAGGVDELLDEALVGGVELDPASILAPVLPHPAVGARRRASRGVVHPQPARADRGEGRVEEGHLDPLAGALALAGVERHRDRDHAEEGAVRRGDRDGGEDGVLLGSQPVAGRRVGARGGPEHPLPGPHPGARVVAREAGQRAVDEPRVGGERRLRPEAEAVHHARPKILDDDVGGLDQAACRRAAGLVLQVERDAALVAVPRRVAGRIPARPTRRVDLDDVRTLVGEEHAGQRPGDVVPEVDDPDAVECACHVRLHPLTLAGAS